MAAANGFTNAMNFINKNVQTKETAKIYFHKSADSLLDVRNDCIQLTTALGLTAPDAPLRYITKTSLLPGFLPLMSRSMGSHYVGTLSEYRTHSRLSSSRTLLVPRLRYCPMCMANARYYHRAHQMPGVTACSVHKCELLTFDGKTRLAATDTLFTNTVPATDPEIRYAKFAADFLWAELDTSMDTLVPMMRKKLVDSGYESPRDPRFDAQMRQYSLISQYKPKRMQLMRQQYDDLDRVDFMKALLVLWGSVTALKADIVPDESQKTAFFADIAGRFQPITEYRDDGMIELRCTCCGTRFITTPRRILDGFGCPDCDRQAGDQAVFERLVAREGGGEYVANERFNGMGTAISFTHTRCGLTFPLTPTDFLDRHERCMCERCIPIEEVRQKIAAAGDYEVVDYKTSMIPMTIRHKPCGGEFKRLYHQFLKSPWCRCCEPEKSTGTAKTDARFAAEVAALTGDEYTVVGEYEADNIPVEIKHNKCGRIQKIAPKHFLQGQRCAGCSHRITPDVFREMVSCLSNGEYECAEYKSANSVLLLRTTDRQIIKTTVNRALQEFTRPTPSTLLPMTREKGLYQFDPSFTDMVWAWMMNHYGPYEEFQYKNIRIDGITYEAVKCVVNRMTELPDGRLERIKPGTYRFTDIGRYILSHQKGNT